MDASAESLAATTLYADEASVEASAPQPPLANTFLSLLDEIVAATGAAAIDNIISVPRLARFLAETHPGKSLELWAGRQLSVESLSQRQEIVRRIGRDIARIDQLVSDQVNAILHHPRFQQLEASWRGLLYLTQQSGSDENIKIKILSVSWRELARDAERAAEFDQSQLFQRIYEDEFGIAGGEPFGVLIGDYEISHRITEEHPIDDVATLTSVAQVAAASFAPFICSAAPSLLGLDSFQELDPSLTPRFDQLEYLKWRAFRDREEARFVGLVLPKVLMRCPYEDDSSRTDGFRFQERVGDQTARNYLFGNAAYAFGGVLIRAFARTGWLLDIRGARRDETAGGVVDGLRPASFRTDRRGVVPKPITDLMVTDVQERQLSVAGFIPLTALAGFSSAVFYSNSSLAVAKTYDNEAATVNSRISNMLQYVLCVSRFAHYLKIMGRDKVGSFSEAQEVQNMLQDWLRQYTADDDNASAAVRARFPLREFEINVAPVSDKPGVYRCVVHLRPHSQTDELVGSLKLTTELAPAS